MYFGKFVMTFIDIGEIDCMSTPKCHWMVVVVNLVKLDFLLDAACWCDLCIPGQYRVFPHLAAIIATRRHGMLATRHYGLSTGISTHLAGLGGAYQDSGVGCTYWWLHGPIHSKYVLWDWSLAILLATPSWRRCTVEGNQGAWWGVVLSSW